MEKEKTLEELIKQTQKTFKDLKNLTFNKDLSKKKITYICKYCNKKYDDKNITKYKNSEPLIGEVKCNHCKKEFFI